MGDCAKCTAVDGCGWCAPVQQCMNGSVTGPSVGSCIGDAWEYKECTPCSNYPDCRSCLAHSADCVFCNKTGTCKPKGFVGCGAIKTCRKISTISQKLKPVLISLTVLNALINQIVRIAQEAKLVQMPWPIKTFVELMAQPTLEHVVRYNPY